jgi:hypothetical protein
VHVDLIALTLCAWLLTYALHSTLMIAAAWMSSAFLAHIGRLPGSLAVVRERLWKLALVGGIATATVQTALGGGPWSLVTEAESARPAAPSEIPAAPSEITAALPARTDSVPYFAPVFLDPASFQRSLEAIRRESRAPAEQAAIPAHSRSVPVDRSAAPWAASATPAVQSGDRGAESAGPDLPRAAVAVPAADTPQPTVLHTLALSRAWVRGLLLVWIAGVLFGIVRWSLAWRRLGAALRGRTPILRGPAREAFDALVKRTGLGARVRLLHAPRITAPITIGFLQPAICLPPRAESELQRDELEALLAHELAHALRRDPAWLCACRAIEVLLFFQPLNRLARVHLADEAEYLCDDWAVRHTHERLSLASCLTEIAGWIVGRPLEIGAPGMAARGSRLELRVRRVLESGDRRGASDAAESRAPRWLSPLACGAVGAVAFFVPGVSAKGASDEADLLARADVASESPAPETSFVALGAAPTALPMDDTAPVPERSREVDGLDEESVAALELRGLAANPFIPLSLAELDATPSAVRANAPIAPEDESSSKSACGADASATPAPEAILLAPRALANALQPAAPSHRTADAQAFLIEDALAEGLAFETEIAALEHGLQALKLEISRRHAPPEFSRRMKALEEELGTLEKRHSELHLLLSLPAVRLVAPRGARTDDQPTTQR